MEDDNLHVPELRSTCSVGSFFARLTCVIFTEVNKQNCRIRLSGACCTSWKSGT